MTRGGLVFTPAMLNRRMAHSVRAQPGAWPVGPLQPLPVRTPASQLLAAAACRIALSAIIPQISRYIFTLNCISWRVVRVSTSRMNGVTGEAGICTYSSCVMQEGLLFSVNFALCRETGRWQTWRPICRPECSTSNSRAIVSRCQTLSWVILADLAPSPSMVRSCVPSLSSLHLSPY